LPVFCQVLNLQRSLLLTCTEEPRAELIHQELKTSACPWRQQGPFPYLQQGSPARASADQPDLCCLSVGGCLVRGKLGGFAIRFDA
jgi:hypothetical protein